MVTYNFLHLKDTGTFFHIFICVFSSAAVAFLVEWVQGVFFGANKTPDQVKASNLDMLASIIAGTIGALIGVIFTPALFFALIYTIIVILIELYRRKYILKKKEEVKIEL